MILDFGVLIDDLAFLIYAAIHLASAAVAAFERFYRGVAARVPLRFIPLTMFNWPRN